MKDTFKKGFAGMLGVYCACIAITAFNDFVKPKKKQVEENDDDLNETTEEESN